MALKIIAGWSVLLAVLFVPAGTLRWPEAWGFVAMYLVFSIVAIVWLRRNNPALLEERMSLTMPVKGWDRVVMLLIAVVFVVQFVLFGLDAVRFQWSVVPWWLKAAGFAGVVVSLVLLFLPLKENPFLTKVVVVQDDHRVVTTGPYAYVRHPMYSAMIILFFALPLALGSFYSLLPGAVLTVLLVVRTWFEDRTLHAELPGYREYAQRTRYRLIPRVW